MRNFKNLFLLVILLYKINAPLNAQQKELCVNYQFERIILKLGGKNDTEIIKNPYPMYNVRTYTYGNKSIRETKPILVSRALSEDNLGSIDTIYKYVKIDYSKAEIYEPVLQEITFSDIGYKMLLKESLNLFKWKVTSKTKSLLGYDCIEATCTFRGRDYTAYFTRELPFKAAPWKFHGLPGVILEIYSEDGFCKWTAKSLVIRELKDEVELSYSNLTTIDLEQYIKILKDKKRKSIESWKANILELPEVFSEKNLKELELPNDIEIFDLK